MTKTKRMVTILVSSALILAAGCGKGSASSQSESSQGDSSVNPEQSSAAVISGGSSESASAASSESAGSAVSAEAESSSAQSSAIPTAQKDVLSSIKKSLNTGVPVILPESVSVQSGKYLTASVSSGKTGYGVKFYQTDKPAGINSESAASGTLIVEVTGTDMVSAEKANQSILDSGYIKEEESACTIDLGSNIKAAGEAGLGHQRIIWNEGRWCICVDSPTDTTMAGQQYPDGKVLAISTAAYLDRYMLPAPQKIGIISMSTWKSSGSASAEWQNGKNVYSIGSSDPMTVLETAVAMNQ